MVEAPNGSAERNESPQEEAASRDGPGGKRELPNQREQFSLGCAGAIGPGAQLRQELGQFVRWQSDALLGGVELQAQEGEDGGWTINLVHRDWDAQVVAHFQKRGEVPGALGGGGGSGDEVVVEIVQNAG